MWAKTLGLSKAQVFPSLTQAQGAAHCPERCDPEVVDSLNLALQVVTRTSHKPCPSKEAHKFGRQVSFAHHGSTTLTLTIQGWTQH